MAIMGSNRKTGVDAPSEAPASGWPALHKSVRDADVTKVDDCRDDIDTLLVFAGLYSAVLTAFVVESYTHLQQDPQDVIIGLLQQIATQRFVFGPGFINSTTASTAPPPFEPPLWAIRVNVLWFTSLLLSLSSASFGILVKQWLREYLAIDYAAPRERLRARQYRYPAMEDWKVFEIAAFLPLLLQLSLGLFFLGLCFFTSAVHQSIGRTTAPLVCAWVFLLFTMTIAPLFSPRCPFKTTFLKRALRVGRHYVAPPSYDMTKSTLALLQTISRVARRLLGFTLGSHEEDQDERARKKREYTTQKDQALLEEDEVVKTEAEDVDILLSVDSLMSDDGLLPTMLDALRQQSGISNAKTIAFVSHVIGHRIGQDLTDGRHITSMFDLHPLTKLCWSVLTDAVADAFLRYGLGTLEADDSTRDWIIDSIIILNSCPKEQLSDHATTMLQKISLVPTRMPGHDCSGNIPLYQCVAHATGDLDGAICLRCVVDMYMTLLRKGVGEDEPRPSLRHLLDARVSEDSFVASSQGLLQPLICVLVSFLPEIISSQKDLAKIPGSHEAVHIVLQYAEKFGRHNDAVKLCCQMLPTESGTRMLLVQFAALHPQCRVSVDRQGILADVYGLTSQEDDSRIGSHLTSACERFCNGGDDGDDNVPLDYVRLCAVFIRITDTATDWAMAKAIEKYYQTRGWREELRHREYWYSDSQSPTPEELFKEDQELACGVLKQWSIPTTELIDALWLFVPEGRREEVLNSIRSRDCGSDYTPRVRPASETGPEDLGDGTGASSASGVQEIGGAGQEGLADVSQVVEEQVDGGIEASTEEGRAGDERMEDQDAIEPETVAESGAEAEGYTSGEDGVQGTTDVVEGLV